MPSSIGSSVDKEDRDLVKRVFTVAFSLVTDEEDTLAFRGDASVDRVDSKSGGRRGTKYSMIVDYPTTVRLDVLNLDDVWESAPTHLTSVDLQAISEGGGGGGGDDDGPGSSGSSGVRRTRMRMRIGLCGASDPVPGQYMTMRRMVRTFEVDRTYEDVSTAIEQEERNAPLPEGSRSPWERLDSHQDQIVAKAVVLTILDMSQTKGDAFWASVKCLQGMPGMRDTFTIRWQVNKNRSDTLLDPLVSHTIRAKYGVLVKSILFYVVDKRDGTPPTLTVDVSLWRSHAERCHIIDSRFLLLFSGQSDASRRSRSNISGPMRHSRRGDDDNTNPYQVLVDGISRDTGEVPTSSVSQGGHPSTSQSLAIVPRRSARRRSYLETVTTGIVNFFRGTDTNGSRPASAFPTADDIKKERGRPRKRPRKE